MNLFIIATGSGATTGQRTFSSGPGPSHLAFAPAMRSPWARQTIKRYDGAGSTSNNAQDID
jgi:hypothetical protein